LTGGAFRAGAQAHSNPKRHEATPPFAALTGLTRTGLRRTNPDEARQIAKEAYIYGFPLVDSYRITHAYFVDKENLEYKARPTTKSGISTGSSRRATKPSRRQTHTPYSFLGFDLRSEPLVLTVPAMDKGRDFLLQLIDAYTHNFAYIGSQVNIPTFFLAVGLFSPNLSERCQKSSHSLCSLPFSADAEKLALIFPQAWC